MNKKNSKKLKSAIIIEDNKDIIKILNHRLEELNINVKETITDFNAAIEYIKENFSEEVPDYVILDLKLMKNFSGDLLGVLRSKWKKTKIYIFTSYPQLLDQYPFVRDMAEGVYVKTEMDKLLKNFK
ncbi:MAG: response regulator [Elusimicrobiota bacterium]